MNRGMDARGLETLLWIVRLGGVGAAARHLNLTQPAVTRRVRALEGELGAQLFRREGRNVALTQAGRNCVAWRSGWSPTLRLCGWPPAGWQRLPGRCVSAWLR